MHRRAVRLRPAFRQRILTESRVPGRDVTHQGLDGDTPIPQPKADAPITGLTKLISTPILGGLHHRYQRVAA
jgi:hypothetical protein